MASKNKDQAFPKQMSIGKCEHPLRIAIVYSRTPLPMRRADQMTVAHLLEFFYARGHTVDLFYIDTGGKASAEDLKWIAERTRCNKAFKQTKWAVLRGLSRVLTRLAPFQVGLFSHPDQISTVREHAKDHKYDVIYSYYFRSAEVVKGLGFALGTPKAERNGRPATFLAFQLSQSLNTKRIAKNAPKLLYKLFYEVESRLVQFYEARIWQQFTRSILIGKRDVEEVKKAGRKWMQPELNNWVYGAHGTDVTRFKPHENIPTKSNHLVFSGVMRTPTNVQAAQWFVHKVWPLVLEAIPDATFYIVGREPSSEALALGKQPGVTVTGTVPDPSVLIAEAAVCVNPMQAGGGMQNKLIEFMACAKPIVATSVANEGVMAPEGTLIIADSPADFAKAIITLLADLTYSKNLGEAARAYVLKEWTWEAHFLKLENEFYACLDH